jgi:hypothetical protein
VGFTAKTDASGPTITGFGVQLSAVYEGGHPYILGRGGSFSPVGTPRFRLVISTERGPTAPFSRDFATVARAAATLACGQLLNTQLNRRFVNSVIRTSYEHCQFLGDIRKFSHFYGKTDLGCWERPVPFQ